MQVLYLGRAPRTKETLPDFSKVVSVTRHPLVFRGLTGSQRTPEFWGITDGTLCQCFGTPALCYDTSVLYRTFEYLLCCVLLIPYCWSRQSNSYMVRF